MKYEEEKDLVMLVTKNEIEKVKDQKINELEDIIKKLQEKLQESDKQLIIINELNG